MQSTFRNILLAACFVATAASCKKDNLDAPSITFSGRIVYNDEPLQVEATNVGRGEVNGYAVYLETWQEGFAAPLNVRVPISQEGTFSALLFPGTYKVVLPAGQGPFISATSTGAKDTIVLNLTGNHNMDIPVTPYYMVRNPAITNADSLITGTLALEQIITDAANAKEIENVTLYVNTTNIVGGVSQLANTVLSAADITDMNNISLSVRIPRNADLANPIPATKDYYARIGVKMVGVEDMIFSPVQKVSLP